MKADVSNMGSSYEADLTSELRLDRSPEITGTKVISAAVRDPTYVLDQILDDETDLTILEHTTDTAGYTGFMFALWICWGCGFFPRLRDLGTGGSTN